MGQEDRKTRDWLHGITYLRKDDSAFLRFLQLRLRLNAPLGHSSSHLQRLTDKQTKWNRTKTKIISVPCIFSTESAAQEEERVVIKPLLQTQSSRLPLHGAFLPPNPLPLELTILQLDCLGHPDAARRAKKLLSSAGDKRGLTGLPTPP